MCITDQQNHSWQLIFKSCAKEKLNENPEYLFRLQFEYKSDMTVKEGKKIKTIKKKLIETEMDFLDHQISFTNVDKENGVIEIRMIIGTISMGKRFNPSIIMIKDLKVNSEDDVVWKFSANSLLNLTYKLECADSDEIISRVDSFTVSGTESNSSISLYQENSTLSTINKTFSGHDFNFQEPQKDNEFSRTNSFKERVNLYENKLIKVKSMTLSSTKAGLLYERKMSRMNSQKIENATIEIESKIIENDKHLNSFCEGFFLASFPTQNAKIIENSNYFKSSCEHKICSMLPAMEPELLYRYPFEDTKDLELNNLCSSICFPSGVKICYEQKSKPTGPKNYLTPITNQKGERYYMMTFHYYLEMDSGEYNKEYSIHPLKHFLRKFGENYYDIIDINEEEQAKLEDELEICGQLGFSEYVYIPFSLVLISKYPYVKQMECCLNSIMKILLNCKDFNNVGAKIAEVVSFLIKSVPVPNPNSKIVFSLPYEPLPIEIEGPVPKDKSILHINFDLLLKKFSIDNIIQIYRLMLLEQRILFVDTEYNQLSQITEAFISLLFPIEWIHTYIPIMSDKMTNYLQTFLPYITGINENLISQALAALSEAEDGIYIVYINKNKICFSKDIRDDIIECNIPNLPIEIRETLKKELYEINSIKSKPIVNLCIKNIFIEAFSTMFNDFMDYLYKIDDYTVFDTKMLLDNRKKADHAFYQEVTERQLFINFIQNISKDEYGFLYFTSILNNLKNNEKNTCLYLLKHTTNQTEVVNSYMKYYSIHFTYIINPPFADNQNHSDQQLNSNNKLNRPIHKKDLGISRNHIILDEKDRIITNRWKLEERDYPSEIQRYCLPGTDSDNAIKHTPTIFRKVEIIEKNIEKKKTQTFIERNKKEYELTRNEKENIKEIIKDTLSSIFQSGTDINTNPALQEIYRSFGREFFCKLVYQTNSIKKIQPDCFNQLVKLYINGLISMCNINETDKTLECSVQLTKSSFYYCKGNTGDFLYDELKMKLKDYFLWVKDSFWFKWIEMEIKEKNKNSMLKEEIRINYIEIIEHMCDKMLSLQVNKEYIIKFTTSLLQEHRSKITSFEEVKISLKKHIGKFKYYEMNLLKDPLQI